MKKITTILMLLMLTCMGAWADASQGIQLTFNKSGGGNASPGDVDVVVTDMDGNATNVQATLNETSFTQFKTGSAAALSRTTNFAIVPSSYGNSVGATIEYTFEITGLPSGFTYNNVAIDVYACTGGGAAQSNSGNTHRDFDFFVSTGATKSGLATFVEQEDNNITTDAKDSDGGLWHKLWNMKAANTGTATDGTLWVKVVLKNDNKGANVGCYAGIGKMQLYVITEEQAAAFAKAQSWLAKTELVTDASNYISNAKQSGEGSYEDLLDNDNSTYFHSQWSGSMSSVSGHDLQARLPEAVNAFRLSYVTRANGTGYPQAMRIDGSNNDADFTDAAAGGATWTNSVASLSGLPSGATKSYLSDKITLSEAYKYLRFVPDVSYKQTNWFCLAELHIFSADDRAEAARTFLATMPSEPRLLTADQIAQINSIDADITALQEEIQNAAIRTAIAEKIKEANNLIANDGIPGYPTTEALNTLSGAVAAAQAVLDNGGNYQQAYDDLTAAIATATNPSNINYTPSTEVYYTIVNARGAMVYDPSKDGSTYDENKGADYIWHGSTTPDETNVNNLWGFIEKDGHYYMYNAGRELFATVGKGSYGPTWIFSEKPAYITLDDGIADEIVAPKVRVRATNAVTGASYTMSVSTSYTGSVITYDAQGDGGVPMLFTAVTMPVDAERTARMVALLEDLTPYREALQEAIDNANAMNANVGEGLNKYTVTSGMEDLDQALADATAELAKEDSETSKTALVAAREAIETALANLVKTLNMPQAGMYRIKGNTSGKYLAAGLASNGKFNMTDAMDATTIFYYDGTKLVNYSDGKVNGMSTSAWAWVYENGDVSTVEIQDGESNGGYRIKSSDAYFFDGGTSADRGNGTDSRAQYHNWYFEEVTELPITLRSTDNETYFATFSAPVNVQISGASLNNVQKDGNTATFTTVNTNVLKAGVGVLLSGTSASATATVITDEVDEADYGLKHYYAATAGTGDETKFYLGKSKKSGQAGFYKLGEGTTSNGFKAYLENTTGEAKEGFDLEFAGVTGIDNMENGTLNMENGAVYNLQGQRVNKAQKGVFIQNGKKVVVR